LGINKEEQNVRRTTLSLAICALALTASIAGTAADAAPPVIPLATGSGVTVLPEPQGQFFDITSFGAVSGGSALTNQTAINAAIDAAAASGGGTVVIPAGDFKTFSVRLRSHVGLHFESAGSILRAAVQGTGQGQDGGFYDAPEVNLFVGLQDQGHSHWANSLIYGIGVTDVMISGAGVIDGGFVNSNGTVTNVLSGNDPGEVRSRTSAGAPGGANKAIALENATNIVFRDFAIRNGGHFAILGSGVVNWTLDGVLIDTNRDAIDIDDSQNVTVRNSVFNSLTDDALVLKGSFGVGKFMPLQNVLIHDCTVSGYDAGSVLDGVYSTEKLVATDQDGPTARVKFGTEGTTGGNTITVDHVTFDRSRGIALESVDGAELRDIVMTNITMRNVSSSPIFIRIGDRGRSPVTGIATAETVGPSRDVRLDDTGWILPNLPEKYGSYPATRYIPSYTKNTSTPIGGGSNVSIVNPMTPTRLNASSPFPTDPLSANAVGPGFATVRNVSISNVTIDDVDPRYPILLAGLVGHPVQDVYLGNVSVHYRGGLSMQHAIEQRQLNTSYGFTAYESSPASQTLSWLANTFFAKNEGLLPRIGWDPAAAGGAGGWIDDPYNVPEMPREYPEPSLFGVLPAYGLYARHVQNLTVENVDLHFAVEDLRPPVVLDDVHGATFTNFTSDVAVGVPQFVKVTDLWKRDPVREYVLEYPYQTTTVDGVTLPAGANVQSVTIDRPAPGTPPDSLYAQPTAPSAAHPYAYAVANSSYPLPRTVFRPFFDPIAPAAGQEATPLQFHVTARNPASGVALAYSATGLPSGATFDPTSQIFSWTPHYGQAGDYVVRFVADDGLIPVSRQATITVAVRIPGDLNGDAVVNCVDLTAASASIGRRVGQPGYVAAADLDNNGLVDIRDIAAISRLLTAGTRC
jgi:polygalacturonase